jgi:hypothetical protein
MRLGRAFTAIVFLLIGCPSAWAQQPQSEAAPVPTKIYEAKKVFVSNAGVDQGPSRSNPPAQRNAPGYSQNIEQLQTEAGSLVVLGHVQEPVYCASGSNWEILCDDAVLDAQMPSL